MNFHTSLTLAQKVALHNEIVAVIHDVCPRVWDIVEKYKAFKILTKTGEYAVKGKAMMDEFSKVAAYYKTSEGEFFRLARFWITSYGTLTFGVEIHRKGDRLAMSSDFSLAYLRDGGFQVMETVFPWVVEPERHYVKLDPAEVERLLNKRISLKKELEGLESQIPHTFR